MAVFVIPNRIFVSSKPGAVSAKGKFMNVVCRQEQFFAE